MKTFLIIGNPNTGKTTVFNALTGLQQNVGNYPGVTVEKKSGSFEFKGEKIQLIDLPGTYSLTPNSPDETISANIVLGTYQVEHNIDSIIVIADSTNLSRNLYLTTQIIDCGLPTILVLNMSDALEKQGRSIDIKAIGHELGVPAVLTAAHKKQGIAELKTVISSLNQQAPASILKRFDLPGCVEKHLDKLTQILKKQTGLLGARAEALRLISHDDDKITFQTGFQTEIQHSCNEARTELDKQDVEWRALESDARYNFIDKVLSKVITSTVTAKTSWADRIDRVLLNRFAGAAIFFSLMGIIFQALFSWASGPMELIDGFFGSTSQIVADALPAGPLNSLLTDGIISGIGAVVIFVPQIAFLFFFISLMEDSGYMARAAFVMDRVMTKLGLHGKAFIPLLSSFACAIPGIMATRTIESKRDRLVTMMVAPLMSCSARLPVYALLIAACIPSVTIWGWFNLQGIVLWGLYLSGVVIAIIVAFILKKTILTSTPLPFLIELPPYRMPQLGSLLKKTWERSKLFLSNAGSIIFALSILLWFLTSYPKPQIVEQNLPPASEIEVSYNETGPLENSFAGKMGKAIEPVIKPLGFDWKIGIGLIASFAAREVFVSTMAIVYKLGEDVDESSPSLIQAIRNDAYKDGEKVFSPLVALSLLIFYVIACQCMATVAVVKRETNSWRWPIFMVTYMTLLAYLSSFLVYQGGRLLGF